MVVLFWNGMRQDSSSARPKHFRLLSTLLIQPAIQSETVTMDTQ
ncbi:hypothetical protein CTA2_10519 [Colletotrichum tanaceti]|uniref:Uncharacterized protein n=1 Tax=Colletotrichum tanaceti TaxID=1306861 RepID=A0A4U6XUI1_9PEZI|nr:hypothetical protein CTA2_10519 [Colletotrichum tanaceti]TKW59640.1 hypothetical protein CTA1_7493 [Colletotrichum tanaceti]